MKPRTTKFKPACTSNAGKQTEIGSPVHPVQAGSIPEEWEVKSIGEVEDIIVYKIK